MCAPPYQVAGSILEQPRRQHERHARAQVLPVGAINRGNLQRPHRPADFQFHRRTHAQMQPLGHAFAHRQLSRVRHPSTTCPASPCRPSGGASAQLSSAFSSIRRGKCCPFSCSTGLPLSETNRPVTTGIRSSGLAHSRLVLRRTPSRPATSSVVTSMRKILGSLGEAVSRRSRSSAACIR